MDTFRAHGAWYNPTLSAVVGGVRLYTSVNALRLLPFTPIPAYNPDSPEPWCIVTEEDAPRSVWFACGTFGRKFFHPDDTPDAERIGYHLPADVMQMIVDWCEEFVRSRPDEDLIKRTEVAYRRNSYSTTKDYYFSYNRLLNEYNRQCDEHRGGIRPTQLTTTPGDQHGGRRAPRAKREPQGSHRARAEALDLHSEDRLHALFHGYSGKDRD